MGSVSVQFLLSLLLNGYFLQLSVLGNTELETEDDPGYHFVAGEDTKGKFVWTSLGNIPSNALPAGKTANGEVLYICRVAYNGMQLLGKAQKSLERCFVGHEGVEHKFYRYEIYVY
uniref:Putative farnesoic acid o-methyltransferase-like protein n=1 Tax=Anopheles braziliensis TaxID=58242 RepID=A0A2M3ZM60_9DIPT